MKTYYVYIITNKSERVLYTGVTNNLERRIGEHKTKYYPNSFSARYNACKLIYFEETTDVWVAIDREKYIKGKSRKYKMKLIDEFNPDWKDLFDDIV